ncbi:MAG: TIGR03086 family metal-binding protein [Ilumatobacteraceae bacterium]
MDLTDALDHTFQHAQFVIDNVSADQYDNRTPCTEWTVRDLLGHTIGVVAGLGAAASGAAPQEFELGDDPGVQFREAAALALAAWRTPGVLDRVIDAGPGPMPGKVLASINLLDTATHSWDIATACGQPATLPDAVAHAALEASRSTISSEIRAGRFGPEVQAPSNADPTQQLVAFLGRQP